MKLLIVDDSELLQDRLVILLSDIKNLNVIGKAKNSVEAKNLVKLQLPDIIITDIRMPGGSGIDLIESLNENHQNLIKIVYTNYPYPQYENKCSDIGVEYFFHKGSDSEELYSTVKKLCADK